MTLQELIDVCYMLIDLGASPEASIQIVIDEEFCNLDSYDSTLPDNEEPNGLVWLSGSRDDRNSPRGS